MLLIHPVQFRIRRAHRSARMAICLAGRMSKAVVSDTFFAVSS